jgi:hypothetical protein
MSVIVPFGLDRADGTNGFPGTATPPQALVKTSQTYFEEDADSPSLELAEQATVVHKFTCDWETAKSLMTFPSPYYRGNIFNDRLGNQYKILSASVQHLRLDRASFIVVCEATSFGLPPDEFHVEVLEFNPALQKHPRYAGLGAAKLLTMTQRILYASTTAAQDAALAQIDIDFPPPDPLPDPRTDLNACAHELANKLMRGEETFYLPGFRVTWSRYFSLPEQLSPGGYIEDPVDGGLPVQFYSTTGDPFGENIFTSLAALLAPQFFTSGISWLRMSDTIEYSRTWFRVTHSWVGGPAGGENVNGFFYFGHWDTDIYNPEFLGYNISDQGL